MEEAIPLVIEEFAGEAAGSALADAALTDTVLEGGLSGAGTVAEGAGAGAAAAGAAVPLGELVGPGGLASAGETVLEGGIGPTTTLPLGELAGPGGLAPVDPAITQTINSGATSTGASSLPGAGLGGPGTEVGTSLSDSSIFTGETPTDIPNPLTDQTITPDTTSIPTTPPTGKSKLQSAADTALKYGPLALGTAGMVANRGAANKLPAQLNALGGPQRDAATGLISAYQSGKLPDAQEASFAQAEKDAIAKSRAYFAKAGIADSSMAQGQEADIHAQFQAKRQEALMSMLTTGLDTLNITDKNTRDAILTELQINKDMSAQTQAFLNAAGQLAARQPQMTKAAA